MICGDLQIKTTRWRVVVHGMCFCLATSFSEFIHKESGCEAFC